MFTSYGIIHYDDADGLRTTLQVSQGLADYYRSFIPKCERVTKPRWAAHATVVRPDYEVPPIMSHWGKHEGERVEFLYDPCQLNGYGYYWVNIWSKRLEEIRTELGLTNVSKYPLIPSGYDKTFHITIGNYIEMLRNGEPPEK